MPCTCTKTENTISLPCCFHVLVIQAANVSLTTYHEDSALSRRISHTVYDHCRRLTEPLLLLQIMRASRLPDTVPTPRRPPTATTTTSIASQCDYLSLKSLHASHLKRDCASVEATSREVSPNMR